MKYKTFLSLVGILLVSIGLNCKKELPTYYFTQDFKDYVLFNEGTYWVFKDSISGNIDSIRITKVEQSIYKYTSIGCNSERIVHDYYSSLRNNFSCGSSLEDTDPIQFCYHCWGIYFSPDGINNNFYYDSLKIDTVYFYNVKKIYLDNQMDDCSYWAKGIGMIKIEKYNDSGSIESIWNLKTYHIN